MVGRLFTVFKNNDENSDFKENIGVSDFTIDRRIKQNVEFFGYV